MDALISETGPSNVDGLTESTPLGIGSCDEVVTLCWLLLFFNSTFSEMTPLPSPP